MDVAQAVEQPAVARIRFSAQQIHEKAAAVRSAILRQSECLTSGNFTCFCGADVRRLFELYDGEFFDGELTRLLATRNQSQIRFRLSKRMTRVGGTTASFPRRLPDGRIQPGAADYEITISSTLLFQSFHDPDRTVKVNGLTCRDRLEALQRVFEHELLHLIEMLVWGGSSCAAANFKGLAAGIFAHSDVRHDLVTQRELAHAGFGICVGDRVEFEFEGRPLAGVVNRITRRATVLVMDPAGQRYSDGRNYIKYYIPLCKLRKA